MSYRERERENIIKQRECRADTEEEDKHILEGRASKNRHEKP